MSPRTFQEAFDEYNNLQFPNDWSQDKFDEKNRKIMFQRFCEYVLAMNRYHRMLIKSLMSAIEASGFTLTLDKIEIPSDVNETMERNVKFLLEEKRQIELEGKARGS